MLILFVEYHAAFGQASSRLMEREAGVGAVAQAGSVREGREKMAEGGLDVAVVSVPLPDEGAAEMLGELHDALLGYVGRIEAVDLNPGMLEVAARKLAWAGDRVSFHSSRIDELPFEDATFDGVMINQVLHHLPDDPAEGFPAHRSVFREFARVLKPGGVLTVSTCSQEQLRHGYWHYHLIPEAADALRNRYLPLDELREILADCGLAHRGTFAPIDATVQGDAYFDPRGPLGKEWRDGDSVWSLVAEDRLHRALSRIRTLDERGELEAYVARNDAPRTHIGQVTVVFASRP